MLYPEYTGHRDAAMCLLPLGPSSGTPWSAQLCQDLPTRCTHSLRSRLSIFYLLRPLFSLRPIKLINRHIPEWRDKFRSLEDPPSPPPPPPLCPARLLLPLLLLLVKPLPCPPCFYHSLSGPPDSRDRDVGNRVGQDWTRLTFEMCSWRRRKREFFCSDH